MLAGSALHRQLLAQETQPEDKLILVLECQASARTFPAGWASHWRGPVDPSTAEEGRYHLFAGGESERQNIKVGAIVLEPEPDQVSIDPEPVPEGEEPETLTTIRAAVAVLGLLSPDAKYSLEIFHEPTGDLVFRQPEGDGVLDDLTGVIHPGASESVHFYEIEVPWDGRDRNDSNRLIFNDSFLIRIHVQACGEPASEISARVLAQESPSMVCLEGEGTRRVGSVEVSVKRLRFAADPTLGPGPRGPFALYDYVGDQLRGTLERADEAHWSEGQQELPVVFAAGAPHYLGLELEVPSPPQRAESLIVQGVGTYKGASWNLGPVTLEEPFWKFTNSSANFHGGNLVLRGDPLPNRVGRGELSINWVFTFLDQNGNPVEQVEGRTPASEQEPLLLYTTNAPPVEFDAEPARLAKLWYHAGTFKQTPPALELGRRSPLDLATFWTNGVQAGASTQSEIAIVERLSDRLYAGSGIPYRGQSTAVEVQGSTNLLRPRELLGADYFQCSDYTVFLAWLAGHLGVAMDVVRIRHQEEYLWTRYLRVAGQEGPGGARLSGFQDVQYYAPRFRLHGGVSQSLAGLGLASNKHSWAQYGFVYHHVAALRSLGTSFVVDAGARFDESAPPAYDAASTGGDPINPDFYFNQLNLSDQPVPRPNNASMISDLDIFLSNLERGFGDLFLPLPPGFLQRIRGDYTQRGAPVLASGGMPIEEFVDRLVYLRYVRRMGIAALPEVGYDSDETWAVEEFKIRPRRQ